MELEHFSDENLNLKNLTYIAIANMICQKGMALFVWSPSLFDVIVAYIKWQNQIKERNLPKTEATAIGTVPFPHVSVTSQS